MSDAFDHETTSSAAAMGDAIAVALASAVRDEMARPLAPGLHLVATPIGNLGDITPRALVTLAKAGQVFCEDTRVSRPMLRRFGITRTLHSYHEHNATAARREILAVLERGGQVALISDAGMPSISDPGFKLVREVLAAGIDVYSVPGPTALAAALTVSGQPTDSFYFAGFLPQKSTARRARIEDLAGTAATLVFYESPHRVTAALSDLADVLGARPAALARELTKKFEEVRRGSLSELAAWSKETPPRGEIAIVVGPAAIERDEEIGDDTIVTAINEVIEEMSPAAAAKSISKRLGVARGRVYDLIMAIRNSSR